MRKPLGADQTVTITHIIRKGTVSKSYTTVLSGVSCREVSSAHVETPGFARQEQTSFCIFPGHTTAAPEGAAESPNPAGSTFLTPEAFKAAEAALRDRRWTVALEDKVLLPSGRTGAVTCVQDNRSGRCPHWYVEVS